MRDSRPVRFCTFLLGLFLLPGALFAGVFTVTNTESTGPGSLAQAVDDANAVPGPHQIVFAIPGPGVHKIDLHSGGVTIGSSITIDGYTQPGASPNTLSVGDNAVILIQLDGGGPYVATSTGVTIIGNNSVVRGLSFTGFTNYSGKYFAGAIAIGNTAIAGTYNRLEGNFIGLSPDGVTLDGNDWGVFFWLNESQGNVVGGEAPAARNIISGNRTGLFNPSYTTITGNYFGTDASGLGQGFGNLIAISAGYSNLIGTGNPGGGNVLTGSERAIWVFGPDNSIRGNLIGPYADGSPSFGNVYGILMYGNNAAIGGMNPGDGNLIAFNDLGVYFSGPSGSTTSPVLSNLFYANVTSDIVLGAGFAVNDYLDGDQGPNGLQNFPIIMSVTRNPGETVVAGGLNSSPSTVLTLQFFAQTRGLTPGARFLGDETVTTNSNGDAPFQFTFPVATSSDEFITATATDPAGNTSEFFPRNGRSDLVNIATRGTVGLGDNILIAGFILNQIIPERTILVRALGPSLNISGALADPRIELKDSNGDLIGSNDNWTDSQESEILATGLAPNNPQEAALIVHLNQSLPNYSVLVSGADGGSGIATVEVYVLGSDGNGIVQKLLNISTRGYVGTGDGALIAGTIVNGSKGQKLMVRAIGPDLAGAGVPDSLQDPTLELYDGEGNLLASNDDWRSDQEQEIIATGLAPLDDHDAAILISLYPTSYTAIVRGKNDTTGLALVELYKLD